ncbi:MAG TPA: ABC transporter substrate-binding protein [Chloroflexota bacterium]|nr:ABC transporter substrate-binding protein [Chloroflexota bacterium]
MALASALCLTLVTAACGAAASPPSVTSGPSRPAAQASTAPASTPPPAASAAVRTVTVAVPGVGISFLPVQMGIAAGIFQQEGLDLKLVNMVPPTALAALAGDQVDYVLTVAEGLRAAIRGVAPVKLVGGMTNGVDWFLYGGPDISTMQALKGKSIGVGGAKGEVELAARASLAAAGLDVQRDQIGIRTGLQTPDRLSQMQQGRLDAAVIASPTQFKTDELGFHRLSNIGDLVQLPIVAWATSAKKIGSNRDDVKRVLRASLKSIRYVQDHQDQAVASIVHDYPQQAADSLAIDMKLFSTDGELPTEGVHNWLKVYADIGEIPDANMDVSQFEDWSMLREVQQELSIKPTAR